MTHNIVFTGGGTAGHVTPNLPLIAEFLAEGWQVDYLGGANSIEQTLIEKINIPFHPIQSGKLRRYFSWKNFSDPFKVLVGVSQAYRLLTSLNTTIVFSKGGFIAFPVVLAAWLRGIPVIAHESDLVPGLANRLSFPFVKKICLTFAAGQHYFKKQQNTVVTGTPIRPALLQGSKSAGLLHCGFNDAKPCLLIMGGSLGASKLNEVIRRALPLLTQSFQVIHICGKGKVDATLQQEGYCQWEYVDDSLADLFAAADVVVSRAGANSVYEILALQKPHVLVPLSAKASRGDQIDNARYFQQLNISTVVDDDTMNEETLLKAIHAVARNQQTIRLRIKALNVRSATPKIVELIKAQTKS